MGMRSSGGLLERPRQAQVEVHRRREVRLKVLVGWGARLDRHCCTSSLESPCAQGGPSCALQWHSGRILDQLSALKGIDITAVIRAGGSPLELLSGMMSGMA